MISTGAAASDDAAGRRANSLSVPLTADALEDEFGRKPTPAALRWELERAMGTGKLVLFAQLSRWPDGSVCLHANEVAGNGYWVPLGNNPSPQSLTQALEALQRQAGKTIIVFPHGALAELCRQLSAADQLGISLLSYPPVPNAWMSSRTPGAAKTINPHLKRLEAESIHIIREAVAEADRPALLYSIGKDSSVLLHLARKAFFPSPPPFPLLHVDTRWKFQEMYLFRDYMASESKMDLLVHINPEAIEKDINPLDHGSALHTDVTKTEGLKQALDKYKFDVVFGGARRDEEKSRAKERVFSFRSETHRWDPKNQRPELWNLYNARKRNGEGIRVFPLSNWTELDIWQYIYQEDIPVVPLYFAKERPVVVRNNMILMVDDARLQLLPGEQIQSKMVRFRTLGCYPLTGAIESRAANLQDIILELVNATGSERQGRAIDTDSAASMEKKKQEGYF